MSGRRISMKFLATLPKIFISLGMVGLVMALMAGLILYASLSERSESFYRIQERMQLLDVLEDDITVTLNQMQRSEVFTAFSLEYFAEADNESAQEARYADAEISGLLEDLRTAGHFDSYLAYDSEFAAELETFNDLRAFHRETFEQMVRAYEEENTEEGQALLLQLQEENQSLNSSLQALVRYAERGRLDAVGEFPQDANAGILIATASLTLLLLALVGYIYVAAVTRPLNRLSNAITAIGGDQYRPELLGNILKQAGPAGNLARALDYLAQEQQGQNAGLKIEIERLRQELYESRRSRLKLFRVAENRGETE
jgi:hypothetical protein